MSLKSFVKTPLINPKQSHRDSDQPTAKFKAEHEPPEGNRVRGMPESTSKFRLERNEHDMRRISKILVFLSLEYETTSTTYWDPPRGKGKDNCFLSC